MKASEARKIACQKNAALDTRAMTEASSAIKKAAEAGKYSVCLGEQLTGEVKKVLQANGYKLTERDNQRDGYECEINW